MGNESCSAVRFSYEDGLQIANHVQLFLSLYQSQTALGKKPTDLIHQIGVHKSLFTIESSRKNTFWERSAVELKSVRFQFAFDYSTQDFRLFINFQLPKDMSQIYCNTLGSIVDFSIDEMEALVTFLK